MNFYLDFERLKKNTYWPEIILIGSLFLSFYSLDLSWFNTHMSRDLSRTFEWLHLQPSSWLGPEMGWDFKRLPGPFYYILLGIFWLLSPSIEGLIAAKISFTGVCIYLLIKELKKKYSVFFVSIFSLQFLFMPVYIASIRNLWNPSLIIAFCCLIFWCAMKYMYAYRPIWIWICTLIAALGLQIHFSVIIPYLAFLAAIGVCGRHKKIILYNFLPILVWLFFWLYLSSAPEFTRQLQTFYGLNQFVLNRLQDLSFHLSLSLKPIHDYDLFYMLTRAGVKADLISGFFVNMMNPILNIGYLIIFIISILFLVRQYIKTKKLDFVEVFSIFWFIFFIISYVVTKHKEQLPYRYGLSLYPVQFFLVCLSFSLYKNKVKKILTILITIIACAHIYFIYHFYLFQNLFGRTHHTHQDTLELTLRNKVFIYDFIKFRDSQDPFEILHGRAINKMRLKEMNWEQTEPYFGLYQALFGKKIEYNADIMNRPPTEAWLFQLNSFSENNVSSFHLQKINPSQLPKNLVIKYFDESGSEVQSVNWKNTNLIMPLAFLNMNQRINSIRLEFDLDASYGSYLNLLLDNNEYYKFAYPTVFKLVSIKLNKKNIDVDYSYQGRFLVQNQLIYKMPISISSRQFVVDLQIGDMIKPNFSRIDIFTTLTLLDQEELDTDLPR